MSDVPAPVAPETTAPTTIAHKESFETMSLEDLKKIADEVIEKVNQPSEKALKETCEAIDNAIKNMRSRFDEIKMEKQMILEGYKVQKEVKQENIANRKALMDKRNELMAKREAAKNEFQAMKTELETIRNDLKQSSRVKPSDLREKIRVAEEKIEVESLSIKEEKEIRRQIQMWTKDLSAAKSTDNLFERREVLEESIKKAKTTMDELKVELDAIFTKLGMVSVKKEKKEEGVEEEKKESPIDLLNKEWNQVKEKIDAKYAEKKAALDTFYEQKKKYSNYSYAHKRQNAARFAMERKQKEIDEAEAQKKEAEAELLRHPFEKEMNLCDMLVTYLKALEVKEEKKIEKKEVNIVVPEGMTLLKKKEEEYFVAEKKEKKGKKGKKEKPLVHSLVALDGFSTLHIKTPKMADEVSKCIELVVARKKFYNELPRGADVVAELAKLN